MKQEKNDKTALAHTLTRVQRIWKSRRHRQITDDEEHHAMGYTRTKKVHVIQVIRSWQFIADTPIPWTITLRVGFVCIRHFFARTHHLVLSLSSFLNPFLFLSFAWSTCARKTIGDNGRLFV